MSYSTHLNMKSKSNTATALKIALLMAFALSQGHVVAQSLPAAGPPDVRAKQLLPQESVTLKYPSGIYQDIFVESSSAAGVGFSNGLRFLWRHKPSLGGQALSTHTENFATAFVPTAIAFADGSTADTTAPLLMFVAGRGPRGDTVIEEWKYLRDGANAPSPGGISGSPGSPAGVWQVPPRKTVTELFRERTLGLDTVTVMFPLRGISNRLLIQFFDSKDIYVLDAQSKVFTKIASPVAPPSGSTWIHEPNLTLEFTSKLSGEMATDGFLYLMGINAWGAALPVQCVVLKDGNKDGTIDGIQCLSSTQYNSSGWNQYGSWTRVFTP